MIKISTINWTVSSQTDWEDYSSISELATTQGTLSKKFTDDFSSDPTSYLNVTQGSISYDSSNNEIDITDITRVFVEGTHFQNVHVEADGGTTSNYIQNKLWARAQNLGTSSFRGLRGWQPYTRIEQSYFVDDTRTELYSGGNGPGTGNASGTFIVEVYSNDDFLWDTSWSSNTVSQSTITGQGYAGFGGASGDYWNNITVYSLEESGTWTSQIWDSGESSEQEIDSLIINSTIGSNEKVEAKVYCYGDTGSLNAESNWIVLDGITDEDISGDLSIDTSGFQYQVEFRLSNTDSDTTHSATVNDYELNTVQGLSYPDVSMDKVDNVDIVYS